jgi:hypothetical protein
MTSDSRYAAVKRHQMQAKHNSNNNNVRPIVLDIVDDKWASDTLSDDEVEVTMHEAAVAPLLEEGELDADAIVVSPTGNSASLANSGKYFDYLDFKVLSKHCQIENAELGTRKGGEDSRTIRCWSVSIRKYVYASLELTPFCFWLLFMATCFSCGATKTRRGMDGFGFGPTG